MSLVIHVRDRLDPRLGRNVEHDSRSKNFPVEGKMTAQPKTVIWEDDAPILDQLDLGGCVGFTGADILNTQAFDSVRSMLHAGFLVNADGQNFYHFATISDNIKGTWKPDDTGSSGLGLAKALQKLGLIDKYTHTFSYSHLLTGIAKQPIALGTLWTKAMFQPDRNGIVHVGELTDDNIAGGHEFMTRGHVVETGLWLCRNHWNKTWNPNKDVNAIRKPGEFWVTDSDMQKLLANQGDGTMLHGVAA